MEHACICSNLTMHILFLSCMSCVYTEITTFIHSNSSCVYLPFLLLTLLLFWFGSFKLFCTYGCVYFNICYTYIQYMLYFIDHHNPGGISDTPLPQCPSSSLCLKMPHLHQHDPITVKMVHISVPIPLLSLVMSILFILKKQKFGKL